jgi:thiamine biosynthesis lipoprotein
MDSLKEHGVWAQAVHEGMGTRMMHKAYGRRPRLALYAVQRELKRLERLLSRFDPKSEISGINRAAGLGRIKICHETYALLSKVLEISRLSGGAFDITVGPLVSLWDFKHATCVPEESAIQKALSLVGLSGLKLDEDSLTAALLKPGQMIDLGGVGKGYASDRAMDIFRSRGITSAFTNIGGNVSTLGFKPDGTAWQVGIRHPRQEDRLIGAVGVSDRSVVTSGDYERFFIDRQGVRRHHLLDPLTGYPAESGLVSATVIHESAMMADALSTAVFVSGMEKGLRLLEKIPSAQAVLVDDSLAVHITKGLKDCFEPARGIRADIKP